MCLACVSGSCVWLVCLTLMSGLCVWLLCLACESDTYDWLVSLALVSGLCVWLLCLACVSGMCVWHVCLACVSGSSACLSNNSARSRWLRRDSVFSVSSSSRERRCVSPSHPTQQGCVLHQTRHRYTGNPRHERISYRSGRFGCLQRTSTQHPSHAPRL